MLFHLVCVACWLGSWFGRGPPAVAGTPPPQASKPASQQHTHQCIRVCLFVCCFTYIYIYIYIYAPHHTDRQTSIDVCLFSLSLYIVLVLVACTLSHHHHHHHTTRAVRVYVCVCIWLPFEQCFRRPDNRPHNDNNHAEDKQQAHTAPLKHTTPRPIRGGAWRVVCVYWCVLLRSCRQRWTGRNTCRPAAAARLLPQEQQADVQETGTHLPTMLLLL